MLLVTNVFAGVTFILLFFGAIDSFSLSHLLSWYIALCLFVSKLVFTPSFGTGVQKTPFKGQ